MGSAPIYKDFGYDEDLDSEKSPTCKWCGNTLRINRRTGNFGYDGNKYFCSLRCAFQFAVILAENGRRLTR